MNKNTNWATDITGIIVTVKKMVGRKMMMKKMMMMIIAPRGGVI